MRGSLSLNSTLNENFEGWYKLVDGILSFTARTEAEGGLVSLDHDFVAVTIGFDGHASAMPAMLLPELLATQLSMRSFSSLLRPKWHPVNWANLLRKYYRALQSPPPHLTHSKSACKTNRKDFSTRFVSMSTSSVNSP
jgi:hypothetical protein